MKRKVLIPLDGSPFSIQIVDAVIALLSPETHELVLLNVIPRPRGLTGRPPHPASPDVRIPEYESDREVTRTLHPIYASQELDSALSAAADALSPIERRLHANGFTASTVVLAGDPRREIEGYLADAGIAMIAITTHGRSGLTDLMMGSVAEHILRESHLPVMMLRPSHALQALLDEDERLAHA